MPGRQSQIEENSTVAIPRESSSITTIRLYSSLKPRLNDRNISRQHIATLLDVRLATLLRHVGCTWLKFGTGQIFQAAFVNVAWCCGRLARFVQQCYPWARALVRFSIPNMSQHNTLHQGGQTCHVTILLGNSANWWWISILLINKWAFWMQI